MSHDQPRRETVSEVETDSNERAETPGGSENAQVEDSPLVTYAALTYVTVTQRMPALLRRWAWLGPALVAGISVYVTYLVTHPYPAFGAGLYLAMAETVTESAFELPASVPGYTAGGVPFAYPPLLFYVAGVLIGTVGVDPIALTRHLPHLVSIVALVPLYVFAEELLESRPGAGLAALLVATAPPLLQWQISAGGIVRAPAYLFTLVGLYAGLRLFVVGDRRWLPVGLVAFTLTVLSHPVYTLFFVLSYLVLFLSYDRSTAGFRRGLAVGLGGAVLSAPWWGQVVLVHGLDALTGAAGTHGGIGKQLPDLVVLFSSEGNRARAVLFSIRPELFDFSTVGMVVLTAWSLLVIVALLGLLYAARDWTFLPTWFVATLVIVSKPRFTFLIGALLVGAAHERVLRPAIEASFESRTRRLLAGATVAGVLFVAATGTGVLYASSQLDSHAGSNSLPPFIDDEDVEAMEWAGRETAGDARFVVMGDAAEWFPYYADRTILIGPWGVEWQGNTPYQRQLTAFNRLSTCPTASCVSDSLEFRQLNPDYVYVPKGTYTTRGMEITTSATLWETLLESPRYTLAYENEGVLIFAYSGETPEGKATGPPIVDRPWNHDVPDDERPNESTQPVTLA